jgi:hypothetical protein
MQVVLGTHYDRGETPWPPTHILAEMLDAIPGGVHAHLAIDKGTPSPDTLRAALNCLDACATDDREPERYRDWYRESAIELRRLVDPPHTDT